MLTGSEEGGQSLGTDGVAQAMNAMLDEEGEALPMIQLLSFALHKLFAEWESTGHHVPQLRVQKPSQVSGRLSFSSLSLRPTKALLRPLDLFCVLTVHCGG